MSKFRGHYEQWRLARINKILDIFGKEYFRDKTVLELGCGLGDIGKFFRDLGAKMTLAEGREEHVEEMRRRYGDSMEIIQLDQDDDWDLERQFDVVFHMGVLYHLEHWREDLQTALRHTKDAMILETIVVPRDGEQIIREANTYDQALHGKGSRVPASAIESILKEFGTSYERYDDGALNASIHQYDWAENIETPNKEKRWIHKSKHLRRFWVVRK